MAARRRIGGSDQTQPGKIRRVASGGKVAPETGIVPGWEVQGTHRAGGRRRHFRKTSSAVVTFPARLTKTEPSPENGKEGPIWHEKHLS